ncbi:MAG TPA: sigma-70 family RNA polymerase sigma factor [Gemmatimonadaceae bacterium]|nr:sigma-70 family RNA polymerase sigma factor [Gemmatimonadaceae bacterium]
MTNPSAASNQQAFPARPAGTSPDIIRRAQAGDASAFEVIYRENSPRVFALCLRLSGGSREEASELMQTVFISAWKGLSSFRGDSALSSWLHRLTVNAMLESARAEKRRTGRVLSMEDPESVGAEGIRQTPDLTVDLERAIAALPEGARLAFVLHEIEGFQHEEIAEQLGVTAGTIKAQLHRARKLLMKALER